MLILWVMMIIVVAVIKLYSLNLMMVMKLVKVEGSVVQKEELTDRERWQHLADLADFALAMKVTLMNINYQSFNNFMLRIGQC